MSESFDANSVYQYLKTNRLSVTVVPETSSTNTVLAEEAQNGAAEGTVLAAHCQTAGEWDAAFYRPKADCISPCFCARPFP